MRQCSCVGTGSKPRTSTSVRWRPTFKLSLNHARITFIAKWKCVYVEIRELCVFGRAQSVIHASGVRRMFMEYCTILPRVRRRARYFSDSSVIVNDTCAVRQWFLPPTPRKFGSFLDAQAPTSLICAYFFFNFEIPWFFPAGNLFWPFSLFSPISRLRCHPEHLWSVLTSVMSLFTFVLSMLTVSNYWLCFSLLIPTPAISILKIYTNIELTIRHVECLFLIYGAWRQTWTTNVNKIKRTKGEHKHMHLI